MKCTNKTMFMIDRLDLAEMFYNENRDTILEGLKYGINRLKTQAYEHKKNLEDEAEVRVTIPQCLDCTFRCEAVGLDDRKGEYIYESFMEVAIWDIELFLTDGWTLGCFLKFPLIGTGDGMMEPLSTETEDMADFIKDLMENDDKFIKEVKECIKND